MGYHITKIDDAAEAPLMLGDPYMKMHPLRQKIITPSSKILLPELVNDSSSHNAPPRCCDTLLESITRA